MRNVTKYLLFALIQCLSFSFFVQANAATTVCGTGSLTITFTFDNNPLEVAWMIENSAGGNQIAGYFGTSEYGPGDVATQTIGNLPAGDYVLIVFDAGFDGLCCTQGSGSFELSDTQGPLLTGSIYEASIVQPFCVGSTNNSVFDLTPPTASVLTANNPTQTTIELSWTAATDNNAVLGYVVFLDGVYQGDIYHPATSVVLEGLSPNTTYDFFIAARDMIGNFSPMSNTATATTLNPNAPPVVVASVIHEGYFENNSWDAWADGGIDAILYNGTRSFQGTGSILLQDNSGVASSMTSPAFDLSGADSVNITFQYYTIGFEQAEDFFVKLKQGNILTNIGQFKKGTDFTANGFYEVSITLDANSYTFGTADQFRIQADASDNSDKIYVDQVIITSYTLSSLTGGAASRSDITVGEKNFLKGKTNQSIFDNQKLRNNAEKNVSQQNKVSVYPNPAINTISLQGIHADEVEVILIYDNYGKLLMRTTETQNIDLEKMTGGIYHLYVVDKNKNTQCIRFMKAE